MPYIAILGEQHEIFWGVGVDTGWVRLGEADRVKYHSGGSRKWVDSYRKTIIPSFKPIRTYI